jgi:TolB-like protein
MRLRSPAHPQAAALHTTVAPRLSIIVLPFVNLGGNSEQDYFVDGVTESLTTDLSRIPGAFVIARNTAFTFKGKPVDARVIGRELGVHYMMEGSVQGGADRIRVNAQLIDTETGAHLWAERFDKSRGDIFEMQDEITTRLARTVGIELIAAEGRRAERERPDKMDAVDLAMRAGQSQPGLVAAAVARRVTCLTRRSTDDRNVEALITSPSTIPMTFASRLDQPGGTVADAEKVTEALTLAPGNAFGPFRPCQHPAVWRDGTNAARAESRSRWTAILFRPTPRLHSAGAGRGRSRSHKRDPAEPARSRAGPLVRPPRGCQPIPRPARASPRPAEEIS